MDDLLDVEATQRVANRALVSSILAFVGGLFGGLLPLPAVIILPLLVVAVVVGISAIRTLNHPEAKVIGGIRHGGIVMAAIGAVAAAIALASRTFLLLH